MEKLTNTYLSKVSDYYEARNYLVFLTLFSVANIGIYYLTMVPFIDTLLEFLDWNSYLAPAASLPKVLLLWQAEKGQWLLGILFAALSLLPFLLSYMLTGNLKQKKESFKSWGFLPATLWYSVDTAFHLYSAVMLLIGEFSIGMLIWEIVGLILRFWMFAVLISGIVVPKQIRQTKEQLVEQMKVRYAQVHGPEIAGKLQNEDYLKMTDQFLSRIKAKAYNARLKSYAENL